MAKFLFHTHILIIKTDQFFATLILSKFYYNFTIESFLIYPYDNIIIQHQ